MKYEKNIRGYRKKMLKFRCLEFLEYALLPFAVENIN